MRPGVCSVLKVTCGLNGSEHPTTSSICCCHACWHWPKLFGRPSKLEAGTDSRGASLHTSPGSRCFRLSMGRTSSAHEWTDLLLQLNAVVLRSAHPDLTPCRPRSLPAVAAAGKP